MASGIDLGDSETARLGGDGSSGRAAARQRGTAVKHAILGVALAAAAALSSGCVVYEPVPAGYGQASTFDRSWNAAVGAMRDQGVSITQEDRGAGIVRGTRGSINVTGNVRPQADGTVRVQFDTSGATSADPTLIDRITRSYQTRMGR
jgi:hypothetical protein